MPTIPETQTKRDLIDSVKDTLRLVLTHEWTAAKLAVDTSFFTSDRVYRVTSISGRITVAGTDASAVTAQIRKAPAGTAIASGTVLHSGSINLKATANTNFTLTLSTTPTDLVLASGDSIGLDLTGVSTAAVGSVTVILDPI